MMKNAFNEMMKEVIEIDGSVGEGGGQLVRNACTYASILKLNLHLTRIREGRRPKAGLQRQHLTGLELLCEACGGGASLSASLDGDGHGHGDISVGSSELYFMVERKQSGQKQQRQQQQQLQPDTTRSTTRKRKHREITGDTQTAGSICLLLQAVLPFGIQQHNHNIDEMRFILKGGTNATMAPQIDYFQHVFLPTITRCCKIPPECIQTNVLTRGFYPRGGGHVEVTVKSPSSVSNDPNWKLSPIRMVDRGNVVQICIRAFTAGKCHKSMGKKLAADAKTFLVERLGQTAKTTQHQLPAINTHIEHYSNAVGSGCGLLLVASTSTFCLLGGSAIGSPKTPLDKTAQHAARELADAIEGEGCVDEYLQDQLILYMALADGSSEIKVNGLTRHTQTAIWLAEKLCRDVQFEVTPLTGRRDDSSLKNMQGEERIHGLHLIRCHARRNTG